jgi:hypothetical protein
MACRCSSPSASLSLSQHVYNIPLLQTRIGACDDGSSILPDCSFYEQFDLDQVCLFVDFASHLQGLLRIEIDERSSSSYYYYFFVCSS